MAPWLPPRGRSDPPWSSPSFLAKGGLKDGSHGKTVVLPPNRLVWLNDSKVKLAKGRKNKKAAEQRLLELRFEASRNPDPQSPEQTVASVIETYQAVAMERLAASTVEVRWPYLQSFAE